MTISSKKTFYRVKITIVASSGTVRTIFPNFVKVENKSYQIFEISAGSYGYFVI